MADKKCVRGNYSLHEFSGGMELVPDSCLTPTEHPIFGLADKKRVRNQEHRLLVNHTYSKVDSPQRPAREICIIEKYVLNNYILNNYVIL